jgi:hypothetical protein
MYRYIGRPVFFIYPYAAAADPYCDILRLNVSGRTSPLTYLRLARTKSRNRKHQFPDDHLSLSPLVSRQMKAMADDY